jgi:hypothetical protein
MSDRVRLGDVAEIYRPPPQRADAGQAKPAEAGDLIVATGAGGQTIEVREAAAGEPIIGPHMIVIRPIPGSSVLGGWLKLWALTEDFTAMVNRFAKGATVRSVAVKDLAAFELLVPDPDVQEQAATALAQIEEALVAHRQLLTALEALRRAETERLYAEAAE